MYRMMLYSTEKFNGALIGQEFCGSALRVLQDLMLNLPRR